MTNHNSPWQEWTEDTPSDDVLFTWQFIQYKFFKQWQSVKEYANKRGISIVGDIPIYVATDSADVWADPSQFLLDKRNQPTSVAEVPPDYFSEDGQINELYSRI